jgi:hypothetical protein
MDPWLRQSADMYVECLPPGVLVEHSMAAPSIHAECGGTCDALLVDPGARTLHVWDFKTGFKPVEPASAQLIGYAVAAADTFGLTPLSARGGWRFILTIVQPRAWHPDGPVRSATLDAEALSKEAAWLQIAAEQAYDTGPPLRETSDECVHCPGRHACPTLRADALEQIGALDASLPAVLPPQALALELALLERAAGLLKARQSGLQAQAEALLASGTRVPGWAMREGRGGSEWTMPPEAVAAWGDAVGVDLREPPAVVSPHKARTERGLKESAARAFTRRTPGRMVLTRTSPEEAFRAFEAAKE